MRDDAFPIGSRGALFDWSRFDGDRFQDLCLDLLSSNNFYVRSRGIGTDGGIDAIVTEVFPLPDGNLRERTWATQIKFRRDPNATVKPPELGNIQNLLSRFRADGFFLITNGRVTNKADAEMRSVLEESHPRRDLAILQRWSFEQMLSRTPEVLLRYFLPFPNAGERGTEVRIVLDLERDSFSATHEARLREAVSVALDVAPDCFQIRWDDVRRSGIAIALPMGPTIQPLNEPSRAERSSRSSLPRSRSSRNDRQ